MEPLNQNIGNSVDQTKVLEQVQEPKGPETRRTAANTLLKFATMPPRYLLKATRYVSISAYLALTIPTAGLGGALGFAVAAAIPGVKAQEGLKFGFRAMAFATSPIATPLLLINSLSDLGGKVLKGTYSSQTVWSEKGDFGTWLKLTFANELHKMNLISKQIYGIDLESTAFALQEGVLRDFISKKLNEKPDMTAEEFEALAKERGISGRKGFSQVEDPNDRTVYNAFIEATEKRKPTNIFEFVKSCLNENFHISNEEFHKKLNSHPMGHNFNRIASDDLLLKEKQAFVKTAILTMRKEGKNEQEIREQISEKFGQGPTIEKAFEEAAKINKERL